MFDFLKQWTKLSQMKVWQKCTLIALPFLIPVLGLLYLVLSQNNENIAVAKAENAGVEYLRPVKNLLLDVGKHRGLTVRVQNGDRTADAEKAKVAASIEESIRALDIIDQKYGSSFKTNESKRWSIVKDSWVSLKGQLSNLKPEDAFDKHTELNSQILELSTDVWEYSTLALDPVADTYYVQDIMIPRLLPTMEDMAKLRGIGTSSLLKNAKDKNSLLSDSDKLKFNIALGQFDSNRQAIEKEIKNAIRANSSLKGKLETQFEEYKAKTLAFEAKCQTLLLNDSAAVKASEFFDSGTEAIAGVSKMYDQYEPILTELLNQRANGYVKTNMWSILGSLLSLALVVAIGYYVTRAITSQIATLNKLFGDIQKGNYSTRAKVVSTDELGQMSTSLNGMLDKTLNLIQGNEEKDEMQRSIMRLLDEVSNVANGDLTKEAEVSTDITGAIADSFNHMIEQLRAIIQRVQKATYQVKSTANEIQASAGHLANGAESQSEQIVHTTSAIEEMSVSILQVSESANQSTAVAQQALENARKGNDAVSNTIEGMNRIREQAQETAKRIKRLGETSQEIGQIIQLIDDIADRTGILALNASIQAAAAGEAGRGFAVVAEEVERLAVRSTDATKKISGLVKAIQTETNEAVSAMERNIQEVVSGSKLANQAGQSLEEIQSVSKRLADLIQSISIASKQQARGSEALAKSMNDISQITQQTAAGTKQTVESVNELADLAEDLRGSVSTFQLPASYQKEIEAGFAVKH